MKTTFRNFKKLMSEYESAVEAVKRVSSQRIGIISGGPSIDDENEEMERCEKLIVDFLMQCGVRVLRRCVSEYGEWPLVSDVAYQHREWDMMTRAEIMAIGH